MATAEEKQVLREKLEEYEGRIEHMYLDTRGFVTVGVGHLLKDVEAAQKLNFVHQVSSNEATPNEIKTDFESVQGQTKGLFAASYRKYTKLKLDAEDIDALTDKHIDSFESELESLYGKDEFSSYPTNVKYALFDMIFNLGMTKLRKGFPSFNKHIKAKDWVAAANESNRLGISANRNKYVKDLLENTARS